MHPRRTTAVAAGWVRSEPSSREAHVKTVTAVLIVASVLAVVEAFALMGSVMLAFVIGLHVGAAMGVAAIAGLPALALWGLRCVAGIPRAIVPFLLSTWGAVGGGAFVLWKTGECVSSDAVRWQCCLWISGVVFAGALATGWSQRLNQRGPLGGAPPIAR